MKIIDISWPISTATTGYKDRFVVKFEDVRHFAKDGVRETTMHISSHTGTHIDAPSHFLRDGKTIDQMQLDRFIGKSKVLDLTYVQDAITRDNLIDHTIEQNDIVLLKTSNSDKSPTEKFSSQFIYLDASGAQYLAEKKIKAVGIDYLGIERSQLGHVTHTTLMHADIAIIEGLRLGIIKAGAYFFICLPMYTIGLESAPARAILVEEF